MSKELWLEDFNRPAKINPDDFPKYFRTSGGYEERYKEWWVKIDVCSICNGGEPDEETGEIGYCGNCDRGLVETDVANARDEFYAE